MNVVGFEFFVRAPAVIVGFPFADLERATDDTSKVDQVDVLVVVVDIFQQDALRRTEDTDIAEV